MKTWPAPRAARPIAAAAPASKPVNGRLAAAPLDSVVPVGRRRPR